MPEEVVVIVFMFFLTVLIMTGLITRAVSKRRDKSKEATSLPASSSLSTSELRTLIRDAVEEAQAPLADRIDNLEAVVHERLLAASEPLLELPEPDEREAVPARRRTRS